MLVACMADYVCVLERWGHLGSYVQGASHGGRSTIAVKVGKELDRWPGQRPSRTPTRFIGVSQMDDVFS